MGVIRYNGVHSEDFGIYVEHLPNYETPERDYENIHVPGRNGDLVIDKGSYKNVNRTYDVSLGTLEKSFDVLANRLTQWLNVSSGYLRLEDTYEPDYYRMALYKEARYVTNILGNAARATITFECKPQRFLKAGGISRSVITSGTTLWNPTQFTALPILTVNGSGSGAINVGGYSVTISAIDTYITINSEIQDVYKSTVNKNSVVTMANGFPKLSSGNNTISFSGGVTSVAIIPQWWTL